MPKYQYPFQNNSLKNSKGEKWKNIPGLEGYFMVSSLGRVKRLEYERAYKNGAIYIFPEKIILPSIIKQKNHFKNDFTWFAVSRVTLNGIRYNFTLARLVYYSFITKFRLDDREIFILSKDGDGLNVLPGNLYKATSADKAKRIVKKGRMQSPFKLLSEKDRIKYRRAIVKKVSKEVTQYTLKGKKIKTYSSVAAAQRATGIFSSSIGQVAAGQGISAGGFVWKWGNARTVDIKTVKEANKAAHRKKYGLKVTQYDFAGTRIAMFPSLQDAQETTGVNAGAIRLVLKAVYKSAKGFFWKKGYGKSSIDLSGHKWGSASMAITQSKKVKQFRLDGKF